ncbi:MAG TPA: winged helix DNA-binding domain-containing protein [Oscillospiraceae bacterium]|nr:AlkZ family DNA glycosylase [Oscillospiraceae bacterium]HNW03923.1 winged helix DNA-binding domain-containing protein [Oscillospiraceae bacterium]HPV99788.1 winged helix DNA-binding domain-containing protein [Oscillospiraceae bacterium]
MDHLSKEQIRQFRLHAHHLDTWYQKTDLEGVAGACGFQNSPPGAWEIALHNRIPDYRQSDMKRTLEVEKTLLQAWSFRGAPVVFPTSESDAFLSALIPKQDEPWIYTQGIQLALDSLQMSFGELLRLLERVMPKLDGETLKSKTALDQTLAEWVLPLLPNDKRNLWNRPSMYGNPEKQTVGGAVVSFLLRPCAFMGLVVFGNREGVHPTFTSYNRWIGRPLEGKGSPEQKLARKYLHCFGPASVDGFADWLGCSPAQANRMWQTVTEEIEPVGLSGKERYILSVDKEPLFSPPQAERSVHLLGGHDPYLGLQDRDVILDNKARQKQIWQTVSNPGAVLWQGEIVGMWKSEKKAKGLEIEVSLWDDAKISKKDIRDLGDGYALFQELKLNKLTFSA